MNLQLVTDFTSPQDGVNIYTSVETSQCGKVSHLHTHGLAALGKKEIMWKNIPLLFTTGAANILNQIIKRSVETGSDLMGRPIIITTPTEHQVRLRGLAGIGCKGELFIELREVI